MAFQNSGLEEITFPSTLRRAHRYVFKGCDNLRTVFVAEGCQADVGILVGEAVAVVLLPCKQETAQAQNLGAGTQGEELETADL